MVTTNVGLGGCGPAFEPKRQPIDPKLRLDRALVEAPMELQCHYRL
jgi:hypothetical protein